MHQKVAHSGGLVGGFGGKWHSREVYLNSSAPIGHFMQAVRQFWYFCLDKWVIECPSVELFEAMDCVFEVRYDLKFEYNKNIYGIILGNINVPDKASWMILPDSWLRFQ